MQPLVLSLLTCGRVIFDRITGLASIIDIIHNINSPQFPIRQNIVFFAEMTNGHGTCNIKVKIVKSDEAEKIIFEQIKPMEFKDVKQTVSFALNMHGVLINEPGEYRFQIYADDIFLAERRIQCIKVNLPPRNN